MMARSLLVFLMGHCLGVYGLDQLSYESRFSTNPLPRNSYINGYNLFAMYEPEVTSETRYHEPITDMRWRFRCPFTCERQFHWRYFKMCRYSRYLPKIFEPAELHPSAIFPLAHQPAEQRAAGKKLRQRAATRNFAAVKFEREILIPAKSLLLSGEEFWLWLFAMTVQRNTNISFIMSLSIIINNHNEHVIASVAQHRLLALNRANEMNEKNLEIDPNVKFHYSLCSIYLRIN